MVNQKIFGHLRGPGLEAVLSRAGEFSVDLALDAAGMLQVEYQGPYIDAEEEVERLLSLTGNDCSGRIDIIDIPEWTMLRLTLSPEDGLHRRNINLNDPLEKYAHE